MRKRTSLIVAAVVAALVVAGAGVALVGGGREGDDTSTSAGGGSSAVAVGAPPVSEDAAVTGDAAVAPDAVAAGGRDAAAGSADPGGGLGGLPTPALRADIVKTASIELGVGRREGRSTVGEVVDAVGLVQGFVQSTDQSGGTARLTVRVPAAEFERTLDRLRDLGREQRLEIHGQDVTGAVTDLEARLRNLRAQEAVLLELMGRATTIGDSIAVQQQLSQIQEQIEQLEGQRRTLADQTSFATIAVSIVPKGAPVAPTEARGGFDNAWDDAVDALVAVTGGMLVVVGALLPFLVLGGAGLLVWRLVVRHRRRPAAPAAG
jgi:hypothetical protein